MKIKRKKSGGRTILEVSGALGINLSTELRKAVLENLGKGSSLELVIDDVTEVDLTFIQILAAAARTAEKGDRTFTLRQPVPGPVMESLKLSGVLNHARCRKDGCVWCSLNDQSPGA